MRARDKQQNGTEGTTRKVQEREREKGGERKRFTILQWQRIFVLRIEILFKHPYTKIIVFFIIIKIKFFLIKMEKSRILLHIILHGKLRRRICKSILN